MDYKKAFINTNYVIDDIKFSLDPIVIKVNEFHDELDKVIQPYPSWAFITAWNPLPQILSKEENELQNEKLAKEVRKMGLNYYVGYGESNDKSWREDSFFILGIRRPDAIILGERFSQMAIVFGETLEKSELLFINK